MTVIAKLARPLVDTLSRSHQAIKKLTQSQQGLKRGSTPGFKPALESLEGREVPSTTLPDVDLSTRSATGVINGATFTQYSPQPTGSGNMNPFLRVQAAGSAWLEQGYNTDARPLQFNELKSANFTHSIRLSNVPQVSIGGVPHYAFMLDINQSTRTPLLSLDQLRIFAGPSGNLTGYDVTTGKLAGLSAVYDLDKNADHWVKLNAALNPGSGRGDMAVYVPVSAFGAAGSNPYVYLFCRFGDHFGSNGGFEEWSVLAAAPPALPPTTAGPASLSGYVYTDNNKNGVRDALDGGFAGVTVTLTGTTLQGTAVSLTTTTDSYGRYSFAGLTAGTYSVSVPLLTGQNYLPASPNIGSLGGSVDTATSIDLITVGAGDQGVEYNFGEQRAG